MRKDKATMNSTEDREHLARLKALVLLAVSARQRIMIRDLITRMGGRSRH